MFHLPSQTKATPIQGKDHAVSFEVEGLYPGYGVTIGNSLRRVLLSSIPGAAVTQVKIKGAHHEFSTLPGVLEDVMTIVMGLKQLRFKVFGDEPQKATLKVKGEKEVTGEDLDLPSQLELANRKIHIATLTDKKAELEIEIQVEKGLGYEPVDKRKKQSKLEIGVMPIDAIFAPVHKISYRVENMRVGERTDFDRLVMEVETDGTITAQEVFYKACALLVDHFTLVAEPFKMEIQNQQDAISQDDGKITKKKKKSVSKKKK